ncbi:MAG: ATP-binding protein [Caldilineaceae bacterium]
MDTQHSRASLPPPTQQAQTSEPGVRQYTLETAPAGWSSTQSQQIRSQLYFNAESYHALLTDLPCVVYRCTNDEKGITEFISDGCEQLTGYAAAEFLYNHKRSLASLIAPADRERVDKQIAHAIAQGSPYSVDYRILHADGQERWVTERGQGVVTDDGTCDWRVGALFDISEQKAAEAALTRVNQDLQENARLIGEFLANISHEIRTPLSVILTIAESLQEGIYGPANNRQVKALERLRRGGRHLLSLVNDILDVAKIEVGKLTLHIERLSVATLCNHSLQMVQDIAQAKAITLSYVNHAVAPVLWADEQRLHQILINLLTNAVKFTPEGGQVGIEVDTNPVQEIIHFTVWDTGIGITREETKKLFYPFVQLDTTLARSQEGTGLGLALVYHLVRLHGGGIVLETQVGKGSRFTVSLPWRAEAAAGAVSPLIGTSHTVGERDNGRQGGQAPSRILVVQDETNESHQLITYLQAHQIHSLVTASKQEAVTLAGIQQPDLIVLDIAMPNFTHVEIVRQLRMAVTAPDIPILVMTTLAVPGHQELWQQAGITVCLHKPVSLPHFLATLRPYLNR